MGTLMATAQARAMAMGTGTGILTATATDMGTTLTPIRSTRISGMVKLILLNPERESSATTFLAVRQMRDRSGPG